MMWFVLCTLALVVILCFISKFHHYYNQKLMFVFTNAESRGRIKPHFYQLRHKHEQNNYSYIIIINKDIS
jgi:hypothetical protein